MVKGYDVATLEFNIMTNNNTKIIKKNKIKIIKEETDEKHRIYSIQ